MTILKCQIDKPGTVILSDDADTIQKLCLHIGEMAISKINMFSLQLIWRILNLAHQEWFDENGLTWLDSAPKDLLGHKSGRITTHYSPAEVKSLSALQPSL